MKEQLVSQSLRPLTETVAGPVVPGAPLLPAGFVWAKREYRVAEVLEVWKETGPCTHGSGEHYIRRHWYRIRTTEGDEMKIYFERRPRPGGNAKLRWWIYTFTPGGDA